MLLLYTFYRSSAAYRVRIALNYKELPHELISINLNDGEQRTEQYSVQNPQGRVPTVVDGDFRIGQSIAILEYLEEKFPQKPLLPTDIQLRARVRFLSQIIVSDMHPLMNRSSVVAYLKSEEDFNEDQVEQWNFHWLGKGFDALEKLLLGSENFCVGKTPTIADACLIPQIYNAQKFGFPMDKYPTLQRIYEHCSTLECFEKAKPENQFDYPKS